MNPATIDPLFDLPDDNDQFLVDPNPHKTIAKEAAKVTLYKRACRKCGGTGRWDAPTSLGHHKCTMCGGRGYFETKVSPDERNARQERKAARKLRQEEQRAQDAQSRADQWLAEHQVEAQWLKEKVAAGNEFAQRLQQGLLKFGSLTENMVAAIQRDLVREAERFEQNRALHERKQTVDITPIIDAFSRASNSLRKPILRTEHFRFSKAPAFGRNPNAIYVKTLGTEDVEGVYLGKIMDGVFTPSRECTPEMQAKLAEVCQDPKGAVLRYARLTGNCGICGKKLDRKDSIERGIGPVCAEKFGF